MNLFQFYRRQSLPDRIKLAVLAVLFVVATATFYMRAPGSSASAQPDLSAATIDSAKNIAHPPLLDRPPLAFTWHDTPRRDLFDLSIVVPSQRPPASITIQAVAPPPDLNFSVQAVLVGQHKAIIIDGVRYSIGDQIRGCILADITRKDIVLKRHGSVWRVDF